MSPIRKQYQLDELYRQQQMQQAEQHHRVQVARQRIAHRSHRKWNHIFKLALYRLGQQLETVGNHLQVRYGDLKPRTSE